MARLNLGWLKPPKVPADGVMSLADHLREFRYRVVVAAIAIVLGMIFAGFFWQPLFNFLVQPLHDATAQILAINPKARIETAIENVTEPFFIALRICLVGGVILASPIWLYQMWAYIMPALLANEKKMALSFIAAAAPLFVFGCFVAYWVLPQGIVVMLQFTPTNANILNLLYLGNYINLLLQLMVVFGIGFLIPVFVVALNLVGIISGAMLKKARTGVIFGTFVFGAAATPGTDPFSMLALAVPMMALFLLAEVICHANDKRRARKITAEEKADAERRALTP